MTLLAVIIGVVGLFALVVSPPLGLLILCVGMLVVVSGNRTRKEQIEKERHEELMQAMRDKK